MKKIGEKLSFKKGRDAGSIVHVGEKKTEKVKMMIIEYNEKTYNIRDIDSVSDITVNKEKGMNTWLDIVGIHDVNIIAEVGNVFGLHPLILEDICNTNQRPKIEIDEDYAFITLKMMHFNREKDEIFPEHISIIHGNNLVITFQETEGDDFLAIIGRILNEHKAIRKSGADYLVYSLLDSIVDGYLEILEKVGEKIEEIEEVLMTGADRETYNRIHHIQKEMIYLRRNIWPMREIIGRQAKGESRLIKNSTMIYFRDIQDHIMQILEIIDLYRDILAGMIGVYLAIINNRMNQIMKVLTIITTIFIPLSFIAGIYGMNFKFMPEIEWKYGYFTILGFMGTVAIFMLFYFKRKKWF